MDRLIVHHNDLDGYVGGGIYLSAFEESDTLCADYGMDIDVIKKNWLDKYGEIVIIDFSFSPEIMTWLQKNKRVVWLDHHISAMNDAEKFGYDKMEGIRDNNFSGAELAWKYCYGDDIPAFVEMVGNFDIFRHAADEKLHQGKVLPFSYGTNYYFDRFSPKTYGKKGSYCSYDYYTNDKNIESLIRIGTLLYKYDLQQNKKKMNKSSFECEVLGLQCVCINNNSVGSVGLVDYIDFKKHDALIKFHYTGDKWEYGIYTDKVVRADVDVSVVAKHFGGGGHKSASGFVLDYNLFE